MFAFYVLRIVARGLRLLSAKCQAVIKCTNQVWTLDLNPLSTFDTNLIPRRTHDSELPSPACFD